MNSFGDLTNSSRQNQRGFSGVQVNRGRMKILRNLHENCKHQKEEPKGVYNIFADELKSANEKMYVPYFRAMEYLWMTKVPQDLEKNWFFKMRPEGKRTIVVAYKNSTNIYDENGVFSMTTTTGLPGGNSNSDVHKFSVLDCIFDENKNIFFILDVLAWNNFVLTNLKAEVRLKFLYEKEDDLLHLQTISEKNKNIFIFTPIFEAKYTILKEILSNPICSINGLQVNISSILFYKRTGKYVRAPSKFFLHLKPFTAKEILGVDLEENYRIFGRPTDYRSAEEYITKEGGHLLLEPFRKK